MGQRRPNHTYQVRSRKALATLGRVLKGIDYHHWVELPTRRGGRFFKLKRQSSTLGMPAFLVMRVLVPAHWADEFGRATARVIERHRKGK